LNSDSMLLMCEETVCVTTLKKKVAGMTIMTDVYE